MAPAKSATLIYIMKQAAKLKFAHNKLKINLLVPLSLSKLNFGDM